jgi:hypothetical protein
VGCGARDREYRDDWISGKPAVSREPCQTRTGVIEMHQVGQRAAGGAG